MSALYSCLKGKNDTIMAANQSEGTRSIETKEAPEEVSGKKKSKFQAFKKLFVKKKRKESPAPSTESTLKPSHSSSDVSVSGANPTAFHPADEPVARGNMGNKAVSHDSVFISEMENSTKEDISQENTPGKVKALQLQLQKNIRIGSRPQSIVPNKLEDSGALSEDDGLPRSPPEITLLHEILAQSSGKSPNSAQRRSSLSLGGTDSEDEPESSESSSHPISPLHSNVHLSPTSPSTHFPPADFTSPATYVAFLDYSAAKHRIAVKPKKRRRPTTNDATANSEVLLVKGKDDANKKVEPQQLVNIPHSEKQSAEQEAPNEVKCREDVMAQESEEDITLPLSALEMDISNLSTENCNIPEASDASLLGKQIVSFQNAAMYNEADANFHGNCLPIRDQVDIVEMKTERGEEISSLTQTCAFQPLQEQNEIAVIVTPPESNDAEVETAHLDLIQDLAYGVSEHSITSHKDTSICGIDEAIVNVTDEELNEDDQVFTCLSDIQKETEHVLAAIETSQDDLLKSEPVTAVIKDLGVEEMGKFASERVLLCESIYVESPVTVEQTLSEVTPEASDQMATNVDIDGHIINDPPPSEQKVETCDLRIIENSNEKSFNAGNDARNEIALVSHTTDSFFTPLPSGAHDSDVDILFNRASSADMCKVTKPADPDADSKIKTPNKPVRFTVAPAWQRALSVGSNVKESTFCKTMGANIIRSESFDGADKSVVDISSKKSEKLHEMVKTSKDESCVPFGVRLRSTSSSTKYSEEFPEEIAKQGSSSVDTASLVTARTMQTPTKTLHVNSVFTKNIKPSYTSEDKSQLKPKPEDLSPQENSEPAWITMARLKQKGFQDHPLARESITAESDKAEGTTECFQKKKIDTSPQELDVKRSEPASTDIAVVPEEARVEPGGSMRSSQPQNPDEPPWFSLAKKKAKAWSEMPQSVQ
ncbi:acrosomal protein KIAA1210 homolog isoform X2 [Mixophyes fleayi]|uniref:acrosomal protein KIAA1210 homolog isoform X2 n=1 Tax=Mixophyes fleayi TaxID=3061075 RepID=UPI003F4DDE1F